MYSLCSQDATESKLCRDRRRHVQKRGARCVEKAFRWLLKAVFGSEPHGVELRRPGLRSSSSLYLEAVGELFSKRNEMNSIEIDRFLMRNRCDMCEIGPRWARRWL